MKKFLPLALIAFCSFQVSAQSGPDGATDGALLEKSVSYPVNGLGGWSEIKHTFSRGDRVLLHYEADKQLESVIAVMDGRRELAKQTGVKSGDLQFTVPKKGAVVIRFINDRNGKNAVKYELRKL